METRKVLQKFIFWLPSPRWCFLNRSCYITSFELVQVGSSAWSHFSGCFRLLQRWAGGPDRIQAILVAFFLFWAQGKIYRFTLFDSDFDLGSSTNHHIDFCDCDWEKGVKRGETPSSALWELPKDGVAACQVWVGELGHFFDACNDSQMVEAGMPSPMLSMAA